MSTLKTKFISDGAVTNAKIATGIDAAKLADGSVSNAELQHLNGISSNIQDQLDDKIDSSEKGAANGVATLDGSGKVPVSQLPNAIMEYQGTWDASTNSPTLADGTGSAGDVYRVTVAGTQFTPSIAFDVGDYAIYNGTKWEKADMTDAVASVNGFTGVVVLDTDDVAEGTNKYFSDELAQDAVGTILTDSASIDFTYDDGTPSITAAVLPAGVDHDQLQNFVANEHVDHSSVSINTAADSGLAGGGDITASRSLSIDPNNAAAGTVASGDLILAADISNANALIKVTAQSIANLAAASLVGADGITISGNDVSVDHDGEGLTFSANQLALELDGSSLSKSASGLKVAAGGITNTEVNASAAIAYSKLALTDSIVNADINSAAAIAYSKLALSNSIVAGDLTANAVETAKIANDAVDKDKIAADVAGNGLAQNVDGSLEIALAAAGGLEIVADELKAKVDAATIKINGSNQLEALKVNEAQFTLVAGDITNQYVDLSHVAHSAASIQVIPDGGLPQLRGVDFTVSLTGGAGGNTRITFAGDLATGGAAELVATDILVVRYSHL
jgi:hypothetical protein